MFFTVKISSCIPADTGYCSCTSNRKGNLAGVVQGSELRLSLLPQHVWRPKVAWLYCSWCVEALSLNFHWCAA